MGGDGYEVGAGVRVLHVTEAMGGGIVTFTDSITRRQVEAGADVTLLFTRRKDTPSKDELRARFSEDVKLVEIDSGGGHFATFQALLVRLRQVSPRSYDAVHLHSSVAGAVGRLVMPRRTRIFYSPHGFGFLRLDVPRLGRTAIRLLERLLSRRGQIVVTSRTEAELCQSVLNARKVSLLKSGVPSSTIRAYPGSELNGRRPSVVMTGRLVYQKAPWRFAAVARALHDVADFVWVGGGDEDLRREWIGDAPVKLVEWLSPDELTRLFAKTDIFLFPTLWEGMALSLIQAQGFGIPAVTSDVVGNRDTVIHGRTGFVCHNEAEMIDAVRRLATEVGLRERMGVAARRHALANLTDDAIGRDSLALYR